VLRLTDDVATFNCSATLFDEPFTLAVTVAVAAVLTEATFTVNGAVVPPAAIDILAGTVTALLLLVTMTLMPPVGAAELNDTVHAVDPAPVKVTEPHVRPLTVGGPEIAFNCRATLIDALFAVAVNFAV
jgi:hypothetical protein